MSLRIAATPLFTPSHQFLKFFLLAILASFHLSAHDDTSWTQYKDSTFSQMTTFQGWCSQRKAERMMDLIHQERPLLCVEVGVFGGSSLYPTAAALEFNKQGIVYAIDPWSVAPCVEGMDTINANWWSQVDLNKIMNDFVFGMHQQLLDHRYCLMRMTSKQSVSFFKDKTIDIIHIDGNHSEESALFDVQSWLPKVKKGGYIWFDDVNWPQTRRAVEYLYDHCELDQSCSVEDTYLLFKKK